MSSIENKIHEAMDYRTPVELAKGFLMYEVLRKLTPIAFSALVDWHDAKKFAKWAGGRLPTEAEWEYAARVGTTSRYWWGDAFDGGMANSHESKRGTTSPVGDYPPNPWGLHDMLGNVWEWVEDGWHRNYEGALKDGSAWEEFQSPRVLRGGSWDFNRDFARCASRYRLEAVSRDDCFGFRLAKDPCPL
jgi:formylglycine-generating enzyme required for sulfatase activity